jgi:xylulokinase
MTLILAHDLGTSGNKAALFDLSGKLVAAVTQPYPTHYPRPGWVEQDPADWWDAVAGSTRQLLAQSGVDPAQIGVVGFSGIMMGCVLLDSAGQPLGRSLIWADTRAGEIAQWMGAQAGEEAGYRITGHRLSASYSAAKALWLRRHQPELFGRARWLLNAKDYLVFRLTGQIGTDYSDASSTNLLDINRRAWSDDLVAAFDLDGRLLPPLHAAADVIGHVTPTAAAATGLVAGTPVVMGGGDGSCACVGAGVVAEGSAYNVIGTSSWISLAAREPHFDPERRTFNWVHLDPDLITPCGTMQAAGFSYGWYHDTFFPTVDDAALAAHLEQSAPGAGGVLFLPYLLGERSPLWDHQARGAFIGLGARTTQADMTRAVFEGIGYNLRLILEILEAGPAGQVDKIRVIGGAARNRPWMQVLAAIWDKPLDLLAEPELATSRGAAVAAGIGLGAYPSYQVAAQFAVSQGQAVPPAVTQPAGAAERAAYDRAFGWFRQAYPALAPLFGKMAGEGANP